MDLTQALAALAAANTKIGELTAENAAQVKRADAAEQKAKDTERQLVEAQSATAAEKTRADAAEAKATAADKARTDAADRFDARVEARVQLEAAAVGVLGRNDKGEVLGADGKTAINLRGLKDREVQSTVIERLDGIKVPAERSDEAVAYAFELATARAAKAGKALGAAREVIVEGRKDAAERNDGDAEIKAAAAMKARASNAWKESK